MGLWRALRQIFHVDFAKLIETLTKDFRENVSLLRNPDNYEFDMSLNNPSLTGIKENCVWNKIQGFHVTKNTSFDIMHDLLEGVCRYDMAAVINYFVKDVKLFSINCLNSRIQLFDFCVIEDSNKPPTITNVHLKKKYLIMSASEMLCLVRYFSVIIGDLVNEDNEVWQFYLLLRQIIDLVTSRSFQTKCVTLLRTLISEHNEMYINLFKEILKPKFHHLVHYPNIISNFGPPIHFWSMRF